MLIPRDRYVAITPVRDPDKTPSGLYIPDAAKERVDQGIVKYTGKNCTTLKSGDYVLVSGYAGEYVENLEGEGDLIMMHEKLILAIIGDISWTSTPIKGVYYRTVEGEYFPATVEHITTLLSKTAAIWNRINHSKDKRQADYTPPTAELLDAMEDDDYFEAEELRKEIGEMFVKALGGEHMDVMDNLPLAYAAKVERLCVLEDRDA